MSDMLLSDREHVPPTIYRLSRHKTLLCTGLDVLSSGEEVIGINRGLDLLESGKVGSPILFLSLAAQAQIGNTRVMQVIGWLVVLERKNCIIDELLGLLACFLCRGGVGRHEVTEVAVGKRGSTRGHIVDLTAVSIKEV